MILISDRAIVIALAYLYIPTAIGEGEEERAAQTTARMATEVQADQI